jgi:hypothetical protein
MSELRDLHPVGDDEDVAALALYRHLHCGHCCPRQNELRLNSEAARRAQNRSGLLVDRPLFRERRCETAPAMRPRYSRSAASYPIWGENRAVSGITSRKRGRPIRAGFPALYDQKSAVSIMLDFVNPPSTRRRLVNRGSKLGQDKAKLGDTGHTLY